MMSLKNAVISVVASVSLIGCAINVSPSAFFYQDTQQKPLDTTKLHAAIQKDKTSAGITRVEVKNLQLINKLRLQEPSISLVECKPLVVHVQT